MSSRVRATKTKGGASLRPSDEASPQASVMTPLHHLLCLPACRDVNVWYVKLENGFVLFFAVRKTPFGEPYCELHNNWPFFCI